jgi:hypothetical protein
MTMAWAGARAARLFTRQALARVIEWLMANG